MQKPERCVLQAYVACFVVETSVEKLCLLMDSV